MIVNRDALVERLRQRLVESANSAGWGYYTGKTSRIEPTCWALLALANSSEHAEGAWPSLSRPHIEFLERLQGADGLLVETAPALVNLAVNGLASVVLASHAAPGSPTVRRRLIDAIIALKGVGVTQTDPRQDSTLQGWPWVRDTFSWVEPTAWCLLALKCNHAIAGSGAATARELEAERVLVNRMCTGGGWNYGNAAAFGQDLRAYVSTTAVGLLALQDKTDSAAVVQSLAWLRAQRLSESGTMTLALVSLTLRLFGVPADDVDERLAMAVSTSERSGNLHTVAMALYALTGERHQGAPFRVA